VEMIPHSDPVVTEIDDNIFMNIRRSHLHFSAAREPIFPYIEIIEWDIIHANFKKPLIENNKGDCVGVFLANEVEKYYKIIASEVFA
jgi:hypothetical protein